MRQLLRRSRLRYNLSGKHSKRVGDSHILDVSGLDPDSFELSGMRFRASLVRHARVGWGEALGHRGDGVGDDGVPQQPALRVVDQVAVIDEVHGLANVHAG